MKIQIPNKLTNNISHVLKKAGYLRIIDYKSGKESFTRKISTGHYPRFHAYLKETPEQITVDMHLDQTKTRYEGQIAHGADYDSKEVKNELERVFEIIKNHIQANPSENFKQKQKPAPEKKSWLKRFLEF